MTENTRGSYPIDFIDNAEMSGRGGHPKNVVMLTADACGVLPPIARLSPDAAMYHFLGIHGALPAPRKRDRAEGDIQHLFRCAVSSRSIPTSMPACSARRSPSMVHASGW